MNDTSRKGTIPSRAMACSNRGAPVRLWSPAPQQEKNEPITITQGEGQDNVPMTKLPLTESPNLKNKNTLYIHTKYSNISVFWFPTRLAAVHSGIWDEMLHQTSAKFRNLRRKHNCSLYSTQKNGFETMKLPVNFTNMIL